MRSLVCLCVCVGEVRLCVCVCVSGRSGHCDGLQYSHSIYAHHCCPLPTMQASLLYLLDVDAVQSI